MEILAPAGNEQTAYAALISGADAIYLGLTSFSARSSAENFDVSALRRVCEYAHILEAKVYVCLNTLVKDSETEKFFQSAVCAWNAGADALLIQDMFLGKVLKETHPEMILHLSTQAGCCNVHGAKLAKEYGFSRVVLARETPFEDVKEIATVLETEVFVQGALCTCFSGQCYFSSFAGNNSGNRGRCKQPCRKLYSINRPGFEDFSYALSPSDLCVGERVKDYAAAGVVSLKIEGRMRRPEYAAAAVKYYRALLTGSDAEQEFTALKRLYNRGDYTKGLPFGQRADFLSRSVQGHIGEDVGSVRFTKRGVFCESTFRPRKGDGFKILRDGKEVGGAVLNSLGEGGFYLSSSARLKAGDRVRVTTSGEASEFAFAGAKKRAVKISLRFVAGEVPKAQAGVFTLTGEEPIPLAKNAPLSKEEIAECFLKTELPVAPEFEIETENAFLPKSELNAFRREFYGKLAEALAPQRTPLEENVPPHVEITPYVGQLFATIASEKRAEGIFIYKPSDYTKISVPEKNGREVYLYLPPFFTAADEKAVAPVLPLFDGIYAEGVYGLALKEKYGVKLFAGAGFNLTNRYAVSEIQKRADYFVLSKELSVSEQWALSAENAFALAGGAVKLMDLCYCPFGKTCASCDKKSVYFLTDEAGRKFPLRRYRTAGGCRFEVFNCARLSVAGGTPSALTDETVNIFTGVTRGHADGSML